MALQLIPLGPPAFDSFTPLSQIGQSFFKQYDDSRKRKLEDDFAKSNADLIGGMTGPTAPVVAPQGGTLGDMGKPSRALPTFAGDLTNGINQANAKYGLDPSYLPRLAQIESGGNINAKNPNSTAEGPFQFIRSTAAQYGLTNPRDPVQAADAAARLALDNKNALTRALGRDPTPGELYLAHQQGAGGAIKLLSNPDAPASAVVGEQAVALNGGRPGMTAGQFASQWVNKFGGGQPGRVASAPQPSMGVQEGEDVLAGGAGPASAQVPVQRSPMGLGGGMPQSGGVAPSQSAPQQMAQAGPGADPFGFSRMPPQVAAAVKSMLSNPLPAAQARAQSIIERYQKTEQWSDPVTDPRTGAEFQVNRVTGERKIFQQPQDNYTVEADGRGNMVQVNTRTNQRSILDKAEGWQSFKGEDGNTYAWNPRNPQSKPVVIGQSGGVRNLITPEERRAEGIADTDKRIAQKTASGKLEFPGRAQNEVTINNNGQDKFNDTFAGGQAKQFEEMLADGPTARSDIGRIRQLRAQIDKLPGGFLGGVQNFANQFGVKLGKDAPAIEVANALISQLVPAQRQGLPGAASDRDIQLFRDSLPKLSNTKEGNKIILDTMEALALHKQRMASIASKVATNRMTREEAFDALEALPDPFERFNNFNNGGAAQPRLNTMKPGETITLPGGVKMTVE